MSTQLSQRSFFQPDLPSGLKYLPEFISGEARHVRTHAIPARKSVIVNGPKQPRSRRLSLTFREIRFA
jgi:hypothetical protein